MKSIRTGVTIRAIYGHTRRLLAWALPASVLAVMPKCPACFAAYAALWTGIGLSLPLAAGLRAVLLVGCVLVLAFLAVRQVLRLSRQRVQRANTEALRNCPMCASSFVVDGETQTSGAATE